MALPGAFDGLLGESVWVAWNDEGGRKVPKSPSGGNAKSNDPSTWGTYAEAQAAASRNGYSGVGIMLSDGLVGIDLDGAVSDGVIADWAQEIVDLVGSYTEVSPSGTGLHILAWADMDVVGAIGSADHAAGIEVYNNRRYFTVTGDAVNDEPIYDLTEEMSGLLSRLLPGRSSEERVRAAVGSLAADEVKRLANRTTTDNCVRDGKRYARVPTGAETCGFCIMLASRGFVYHSRETAGEFDHYHRSCDCKVIGDLDELTEVEGYDPDALYDLYSEARSRLGEYPAANEISQEIERVLAERAEAEAVAESESEDWKDAQARRTVDMSLIGGKAYRSNVRALFGDLHETAYADIARMLGHRSGTPYEDLYAYDMDEGTRLGSVVTSTEPKRVEPTADLSSKMAAAVRDGHEVIMVHNHPDSSCPSASDIRSLIATGARRGVIACHDGSLYSYEVVGDPAPGYTVDDDTIRMLAQLRGGDEADLLKGFEESLGVHVEHLR